MESPGAKALPSQLEDWGTRGTIKAAEDLPIGWEGAAELFAMEWRVSRAEEALTQGLFILIFPQGVPGRLRCLLLQHGQHPTFCHCPASSDLCQKAGGGECHLAAHQHSGGGGRRGGDKVGVGLEWKWGEHWMLEENWLDTGSKLVFLLLAVS